MAAAILLGLAAAGSPPAAARAVGLRVQTVMRGLDIPWDTAFLPNGDMLVTERDRQRILLRTTGGRVRVLASRPAGMWSNGEAGLMSLAVDPAFPRNRRFYTCHTARTRSGLDVRVVAWRLNVARSAASRVDRVVTGLPVTTGRHAGCRLEIAPNGRLWIGTGDAATDTAQRVRSLGGKVLRVDRFTGAGVAGNPFSGSTNANARRVYSYGHRNVQGLAFQAGVGMWSVEHGTDRDDEVNFLLRGGNYGWSPGPSYDESRPMTDHSLPGPQVSARWSSGFPTVATSGAAWITGRRWGPWRGRLVVAALKNESLRIMRFDSARRLVSVRRPAATTRFGRLRSVTVGPANALYVTTSNGGGNDRVLRITPVP
jgi:glucose/arabinose dehydrogenase